MDRQRYQRAPIKTDKTPAEYQKQYDAFARRRDRLLEQLATCPDDMVARVEYRLGQVRQRMASTAIQIGVAARIAQQARKRYQTGDEAVEITHGNQVTWDYASPRHGETIAALCARIKQETGADHVGPK